MSEEKVFFNQGGVTITQTRFLIPGQTFAMSGVTSVATSREDPSRKWPILLIIVGAIVFLAGVSQEIVAAIVGLILAGLGVLWFRSLKPTFYIGLHTAGVENRALESKDEQWINGIATALNQAIIARG